MLNPRATESDSEPRERSRGYDSARRRRATRSGRQRGCFIYIAADELVKAGINPDGPVPYYRVWSSPRGGIRARLYREP